MSDLPIVAKILPIALTALAFGMMLVGNARPFAAMLFAWILWHDVAVYRADAVRLAGPTYRVASLETRGACETEQRGSMASKELPRSGPGTERLTDGIEVGTAALDCRTFADAAIRRYCRVAMCAPGCVDWWRALGRAASRRDFVKGALALPLVAAGCATASPANETAGRALLDDVVSVDVHTHPALFQTYSRTTIDEHARAVQTGKVGGAFLAAVGDGAALAIRPNGTPYAAREPGPGVLFSSSWRQLDVLDGHARVLGMRPMLRGADLTAAAAAHGRVALMSVEGADFLEGRLDNVQRAYDRGVRSIQLVHYRVNELGDIQTEPPVHNGLTPFGRDVVREMNRLGMLIDLAHAPLPVVKHVVDASARPMLVSHTNIEDYTGYNRFVSREHARLVAQGGGVLGAWPISIRPAGFSTFIDHIKRMVDAVGVDHVAIGTDLAGVNPRSALFSDWAAWPSIPAALLDRGFARADVVKIMGGNMRRLLEATLG